MMTPTYFPASLRSARPISISLSRLHRGLRIIQEYNFYTEALPIVLVGILLNVVGRQAAAFHNPLIFVDMIGTAFTAILLGPWWAAATAAATTLVNGSFFETYFPFGVVNVAGGLVWGYLARVWNVRDKVFGGGSESLKAGVTWTVMLTLAGAFGAGLASSAVKLTIFPAVGRPLVLGDFYLKVQGGLEQVFGTGVSPELTLLVGDLLRDLMDKSIVFPLAMILVALSRAGEAFGESSRVAGFGERLRTDVLSIFIFGCAYLAFILLAQLLRPVINYPGAEHSIAWLQHPRILLLMCSPLVLASFALIFLTFRLPDPYAGQLHALTDFRRYVFRNIFRANNRLGLLLRSQGVKPLGLAVSLWSLRGIVDTKYASDLALIAIGAALVIYFVAARRALPLLRQANTKMLAVHRWLEVGGPPGSDRAVIVLMRDLFSGYLSCPSSDISIRLNLLYTLGFLSDRPGSRLEDLLIGRRHDLFFERVAIVGVVEEPKALTLQLAEHIHNLVIDSGAKLVVVLSSTPRVIDEQVIAWLREIKQRGADVLLLDWTDLLFAIAECTFGGQPRQAVQRAKTRFLQALNNSDLLVQQEFSCRSAQFAHRALPSLKFIIDLIPKRSRVFDLGCGRGRHTFAALAAGHQVIAVDQKPSICQGLKSDIAALGPDGRRATIVEDDFINISLDEYGAADLVIVTGVLQHARDRNDLVRRLAHIASLAAHPASRIYLEMLFDMLFDGTPPRDGRIVIQLDEFVEILREIFPRDSWTLEQTCGPIRQRQFFDEFGRSFEAPSRTIESVAVEYLIRRAN